MLSFKVFKNMLSDTLDFYFNVTHLRKGMRSTNNFSKAVCKSNIRSFNIILVALRLQNILSGQINGILTHVPFKLHIKEMCLKMYLEC